jgi:hypothetical protein
MREPSCNRGATGLLGLLQHSLDLRSAPLAAPRGPDPSIVETSRDMTKRRRAGGLQFGNDWCQVGGPALGAPGAGGAPVLPSGLRIPEVLRIAQLHPVRLGGGKRLLSAITDQASLELRHSRHLLQHEPAGRPLDLGQVAEAHLDTCLEQPGQERHRAGQARDIRHHQRGSHHPAPSQGLSQLWPLRQPAALDLHDLADQLPVTAIEEASDGRLLRLQAEAGAALLVGGDAVIGDEAAVHGACFTLLKER